MNVSKECHQNVSTCKEIRLLRLAAGVVWSRFLICLVVKVGDGLCMEG